MPLGTPGRAQEPILVVPMALALALAAFAGGALGLVWHNLSDRGAVPVAEETADESGGEATPSASPSSATPSPAPTSAQPAQR
jgi:hypothetical protein